MNIVYFYQYYTTPKGSYSTRVYEFTKRWVEMGHDVTVITSVYKKSDISTNKFIDNQTFDGVKVIIINVSIDNKQSTLRRIWSFFRYMTISSWYALTFKTDVVISSSGPITVGLPGLIARYVRGRKFIFEVRDLWPEVAVELGIIRNNVLIRVAYWFEKRCYKAASHIITLSQGMKTDIENRYGYKNITSITNSANIQLFGTRIENPDLKGLKPLMYAIYNGNIGEVNNSVWLYNAARILTERDRGDIKIVLAGEGQQKYELEQKSFAEGVNNFILLGMIPKYQLIGFIQNAMVSLVPLKGAKILDTSSPNKFFESLAAGIPVIQNTNGWMKNYLQNYQVGFTLDPNDPEALADLLIECSKNHDQIREMGNRAKILAAEEFDKDILADKMLNTIITSIS